MVGGGCRLLELAVGEEGRQVSTTAAARLELICAAWQSGPVAQSGLQVWVLPSSLSWLVLLPGWQACDCSTADVSSTSMR
ncbi:hypothetical protein O3P69_020631 [Scylla paramamosain]|uniref:Uncharacterized protein n=1 Tax=Scylla paramamosain TaxID=85552 RepID=A0AAW0TN82_SCYPA